MSTTEDVFRSRREQPQDVPCFDDGTPLPVEPDEDGWAPVVAIRKAPALVAETASAGEVPSWAPMDVSAFLSGDYEATEPTVWEREDGQHLLYPGRVSALIGESESGKSFLAHHVAAELLKDGKPVLIVDYESQLSVVASRLLKLGVPPELLGPQYLTYVRPDTDPSGALESERLAFAELLKRPYALAVVDGVNESLATMGYDSNSNNDVTAWSRKLPKHIARETGAAVLLVDHVAKNTETRGRFAIGAQAKMATLDGVSISVDVIAPLAPGALGELRLLIGKDREGLVRAGSVGFHKATRQAILASVFVDSTAENGDVVIRTELPSGTVEDGEGMKMQLPTVLMGRISEHMHKANCDLSRTRIKEDVTGKAVHVLEALDALVKLKYVEQVQVDERTTVYRLLRVYFEGASGVNEL